MPSSRDRRAARAFKQANAIAPTHYSLETITHLASEVHDLALALQKEETGLSLRSYWVEEDLSFVAVLENERGESLSKLQITPLSSMKAQIVASYPSGTIKQKIYHHMNSPTCVDRFMSDLRGHLQAATPEKLKEAMLSILNGQDINTPEFKDLLVLKMEVIPAKYAGTADPHQAYALAHQATH
jgi:hypothetical protein